MDNVWTPDAIVTAMGQALMPQPAYQPSLYPLSGEDWDENEEDLDAAGEVIEEMGYMLGMDDDEIDDLIDATVGARERGRGRGRGRGRERRERRERPSRRERRERPSRRERGMDVLKRRATRGIEDRRAALRAQVRPSPRLVPGVPGTGQATIKRLIAAFPSHTFLTGGLTSHTMISEPEKQVIGARLITDWYPNTEAIADGVVPLMGDVKVGTDSAFISEGQVRLDTFSNVAVGTGIEIATASIGQKIKLPISLSGALTTVGAAIVCTATIIGPSIA